MIVKILDPNLIRKLQAMPETGMGYQDVEVIFSDGSRMPAAVYNCENLEFTGNRPHTIGKTIVDFKLRR